MKLIEEDSESDSNSKREGQKCKLTTRVEMWYFAPQFLMQQS